ncbi:hypothetical protein DAETH_09310 [Deinococcus aetherius]|uniref:Uncharacterized protein n=1 Tax=Deinococcus aetherius TaxID=200252 RepID=A0ABN6RCA7_9DEIO|nr:hypothetical protein [Deinococcus aetherius]BDP40962.1 hypothetical protein DAETH_09310 [Deinococcus aetherius]
MDDSTNGRSGGTGPQDNVPQEQVQTNPNWDTGGEKSTGDAIQDGIYQHVSDENAGAGADDPVNQGAVSDDGRQPSAPAGGVETDSQSYGGYSEGMPASAAAANPEKTVDGEQGS